MIKRRIRGIRVQAPPNTIIGRKRQPQGGGDAQFLDMATLGQQLIASGSVAPPGSGGTPFTVADKEVVFSKSVVATGDATFVWDYNNHRLGIGNGTPASKLHVGPLTSALSAEAAGLLFTNSVLVIDQTNICGTQSIVDNATLNPPNSFAMYTFWVPPAGTITAGAVASVDGETYIGGSQNLASSTPVLGGFFLSSNFGSGAINSVTGIQIAGATNTGAGSITNAYGLYVGSQTVAANSYAIRTFLGQVDIGDNATFRGFVTIAAGKWLELNGSSSGTLNIKPPAIAGSNSITLPAGTTDFSATGGTSQVVKQNSAGGAFTVGQVSGSDISSPLFALVVVNPDGTIPHNPDGTLGYVISTLP